MLIANGLGILTLFFLLWKTLKEDYQAEKIFNLGFIVLICFALTSLISNFILKDFWFWIMLVGVTSGLVITVKKQKMKFFEVFESFIISILPWICLFFLNDTIKRSSLTSFLAFWISLICVFLLFLIRAYYRSFSWYKSGKVGLASVLTVIVFFLFRILGSIFLTDLISVVKTYDVYFSLTIVLLLFLLLYSLITTKE